jgi:hypothetical protein
MVLKKIKNSMLRKGLYVSEFKHNSDRRRFMMLLKDIIEKTDLRMSYSDAINIRNYVRYANHLDGCMAEVGVYKGGSARIICQYKGDTELLLFDTFKGIPKLISKTDSHSGGLYKGNMKMIADYLKDFSNVKLIKGIFPSSAGDYQDRKFSFVNLDTDIYQSTKDSLEFFYPRMQDGGAIIVHDYITLEGVKKAVAEFLHDKKEFPIETAGSQCIIIKQNGKNQARNMGP